MRLHVKAFALTVGVFCGLVMLVVAAANLFWPSYGRTFLDLAASVYPGYQPSAGIGSVLTGTIFGFIDGAIGGALFAWLYNLLSHRRPDAAA